MYSTIKRYGHEQGFSCCFRQWRAVHSHCRHLHGYALSFELEFVADRLDDNNWVMDFGGLKPVKQWLQMTFDHSLAVAKDDPERRALEKLEAHGLARIVLMDSVGCEAFAQYVFEHVRTWLLSQAWNVNDRVRLYRVRVSEHNGNHAEYFNSEAV